MSGLDGPVAAIRHQCDPGQSNVIGHSVTGTQDQGLTGEGLTATLFRELKPGVVDAMFDAFAPLRCACSSSRRRFIAAARLAWSRVGQRRRARGRRLSRRFQ